MKLSYFLKEKFLRRRDVLYNEGEQADGIYFIKEGSMEISVKHKVVDEKEAKLKIPLKSPKVK